MRTTIALALLLAAAPAAAEVAPGSASDTATGLTGAYADNPFARILAGKLPAAKVYEDRTVLAFMNIHPLSTGDLLVIPKGHYRTLIDIPRPVLDHLIDVTQRLAKAQMKALRPDGIFIRQNSGEAAGQTVFHFHMHVTPQWKDVPLAQTSYKQSAADPKQLAAIAAKIHAAMR
ncbi:HIT domain-containing protein [Sphingomonas sp. CGMCC 1.13654]|uniref:HIT domain-containing protein n=1 Tax=Sphingomonas chungangi TaxID=2683589 RepID=A0A838L877_9SPHN|nr:HIT domain-containing protein [Sphingomonas chungangi]